MPPSAVTVLARAVADGEDGAFDALVERLYPELRALARDQRARWGRDGTLGTTELVHEAYLKLAGAPVDFEGRAHVLGVAARAMRQVLVDRARSRAAQKRGGPGRDLPLDAAAEAAAPPRADDILSLDAALGRLAEADPRAVRVVECRFFGGMTLAETAVAVGVSVPTVSRSWAAAQAWLYREIHGDAPCRDRGGSAARAA